MNDVSEFDLELTEEWPSINNLKSFVNDLLIEKWILFRTEWFGYGSYPRTNLRLISSFCTVGITVFFILVTAFLCDTYLINPVNLNTGKASYNSVDETNLVAALGSINHSYGVTYSDLVKFLLSFFAAVGLLFWRERTTHYDKWKYLASLYNEYVIANNDANTNMNEREILISSLALDLIDLGMWRHNSFNTFFKNTLVKSLALYNSSHNQKIIVTRDTSKSKMLIKIDKDLARKAIQAHQHKYLPDSDSPKNSDYIASSIAA